MSTRVPLVHAAASLLSARFHRACNSATLAVVSACASLVMMLERRRLRVSLSSLKAH